MEPRLRGLGDHVHLFFQGGEGLQSGLEFRCGVQFPGVQHLVDRTEPGAVGVRDGHGVESPSTHVEHPELACGDAVCEGGQSERRVEVERPIVIGHRVEVTALLVCPPAVEEGLHGRKRRAERREAVLALPGVEAEEVRRQSIGEGLDPVQGAFDRGAGRDPSGCDVGDGSGYGELGGSSDHAAADDVCDP